MKRKIYLISLVLSISVTGAGCSKVSNYFGGKDNSDPPAKLTKYTQQIIVKKSWNNDVGAGTGKLALRLRPFILGDKVYTADYKGKVSIVSLTKGRTIWTTNIRQEISSGPTVVGNIIVVGTSDGQVVAIDRNQKRKRPQLERVKSKKKLNKEQKRLRKIARKRLKKFNPHIIWSADVPSEVLAPPVAANSVILVRTIDGTLTGLDARTGKKRWSYRRRTPILSIRGNSMPVVLGSRVFMGTDDGKLAAVDINTGRVYWEKTVSPIRGRTELERLSDIDSDPVIFDGILYINTFQGKLAAVQLSTGQLMWTRKVSSYKSIFVSGRQIFLTDENSHVWAYDRDSGQSLWKQDKLHARKVTGPVVLGDYVVVADFEGYIHWLSRADGKIVERVRGDGDGYLESPILHNDSLVLLGRSGKLSLFRISPKKPKIKKSKK